MASAATLEPLAPSSSPLESLPAELRDRILWNMPDLPTLHSIVRASPVMHAQYRSNRDKLLRACLERGLDGFLVHAHACQMSRLDHLGENRAHEVTIGFLEGYREWLPSGSNPCANLGSVNASDCRWMAAFHLTVIRPLTRLYSRWAFAKFRVAAAVASAEKKDFKTAAEIMATVAAVHEDTSAYDLSRSEEIRIMRALYQTETYHHLIGYPQMTEADLFLEYQSIDMFFSFFDPWEAEALGCIDVFFTEEFGPLFGKLSVKLRRAYAGRGPGYPIQSTRRNSALKAHGKVLPR